MVGVMAKPTITKSCSHDKVVTENKPCNAGINKIQDKNRDVYKRQTYVFHTVSDSSFAIRCILLLCWYALLQ